jgi:hypothetical protein
MSGKTTDGQIDQLVKARWLAIGLPLVQVVSVSTTSAGAGAAIYLISLSEKRHSPISGRIWDPLLMPQTAACVRF